VKGQGVAYRRYEGLLAAALACNAAGGSAGEHNEHTQWVDFRVAERSGATMKDAGTARMRKVGIA